MFGYVLPSRDRLDERERERFRAVYCGLCHTLRERYGFAASLLLNYDFTLLAILLSSGDEESCTVRRCAVHPCKGCRAQTSTPALEAAADRTVILSWWQLRDHIADHGFWRDVYKRQLFKADEMLALRLAVMHNLYFYNKLTERIRDALDAGEFAAFRTEYSEKLSERA